MTHRGPFQPRPFCDSVILCRGKETGTGCRRLEEREHGCSLQPTRRAEKGDLSSAPKRGSPVLRRAQQKACGEAQPLATGELRSLPDAAGIHEGSAGHTERRTVTVQQTLLGDGLYESSGEGLKAKPELQRSDLGPDLNHLS